MTAGAAIAVRLALARAGGFRLDVDLHLPGEGITALFGPSGSGKTTLLRCVAGLEHAAGAVRIAGQPWQDDGRRVFLPTWRRALGYVFQEASLFDHLDVRANLAFGQRRGGADARALADAVELLGIGALLDRRTDALSGGERQRVAIARALATQPRLLLLDEPLAALDARRRQDVLPWLERLRDELRLPMLYVTHSADEVIRLADTVVLLDRGRVSAQGPLAAMLAAPGAPLGVRHEEAAILPARVAERDTRWQLARLEVPGGSLWLGDEGAPVGSALRVRVLARDVALLRSPPGAQAGIGPDALACTVQEITPAAHPSQRMVRLDCDGTALLARTSAREADALGLAPGAALWARVHTAELVR